MRDARIAVLLGCTVLAACTGNKPATQPATPGPTQARATASPVAFKVTSNGQGGQRVVLTERRRGRVVYVLHADANVSNRFAAGTGHSVFTNPHIVFYQPGGKTLTAVSPAASVEEVDKTVLMSGGVHAHTADGVTLTCDTLEYDDRNQMMHGRGNVVVTSPRGERLNGDTLDTDTQLNNVRVSGSAP